MRNAQKGALVLRVKNNAKHTHKPLAIKTILVLRVTSRMCACIFLRQGLSLNNAATSRACASLKIRAWCVSSIACKAHTYDDTCVEYFGTIDSSIRALRSWSPKRDRIFKNKRSSKIRHVAKHNCMPRAHRCGSGYTRLPIKPTDRAASTQAQACCARHKRCAPSHCDRAAVNSEAIVVWGFF